VNVRAFRFGASVSHTGSSRSAWRARAREVEDLGYDVLQVPDHLGLAAPFPALVAAAEVTGIRLGTYVLNAGVWSPAYLARDVADTYRLTDGRLELGLGAGYVPEEFTAAGLPFGTPGSRLRKLEEVITGMRRLLAAESDAPRPPVMVAGAGGRILTLAARTADVVSLPITVGFGAGTPEQALAVRVRRVREPTAERIGDIELNLFVAGSASEWPTSTCRSSARLPACGPSSWPSCPASWSARPSRSPTPCCVTARSSASPTSVSWRTT
jgi:probable F420-dependent oxidoreductase